MPKESFRTRLTNYLDAAYPVLAVESHEELRVISDIRAIARERKWKPDPEKKPNKTEAITYAEWDAVSTMEVISWDKDGKMSSEQVNGTRDPIVAFTEVANRPPGIYVFKDMHHYLGKDLVSRKLRNILGTLKESGSTIILVSPRHTIPVELAKEIQMVDFDIPTRDDLQHLFNSFVDNSIRARAEYKNLVLTATYPEAVAEAAMGMTEMEADNAFSLSYIAIKRAKGEIEFNGEFTTRVFEEKISALRNSALEYMPTVTGFEQIGGMENLKVWSMLRRQGFESPARAVRLPYPKGILLAGIKGTGKTVTSMAIAKEFGFPLFKMDVGKLFASKVGETEANTRELIRILEGLGRAVILLDEIEKSFNTDATSGGGDSGVSSRLFGSLISWMALKKCPIFIVGTLNNHERIPPELLRKGRFDEIFWCDLPTPMERASIFKALLNHRYKPEGWDDEKLSMEILEHTRDFTGAEIEAAIQEALYASLAAKEPFEKLLLAACDDIKPQAQLDHEGYQKLMERAKAFKPASSTAESDKPVALPSGTKRGRKLGV
jgi:SpoVK/Ycf46/Vps4 family AAA+-type ATPase